jgi:hypothetical protein
MKDVNNRVISRRFPKQYDKKFFDSIDNTIKKERKGQIM